MKKEYQMLIIISIILFIVPNTFINNFFVEIILWVIAILLLYTSLRLNEEDLTKDHKKSSDNEKKKDNKKK